jgi:hypothetical protein
MFEICICFVAPLFAMTIHYHGVPAILLRRAQCHPERGYRGKPGDDKKDYSALAPTSCTILPHFAVSVAM